MKFNPFENPQSLLFNLKPEDLNPNNPEKLINIFAVLLFLAFLIFSYIYLRLKPENKESIKKISKSILSLFLGIFGFWVFLRASESIFKTPEQSLLFSCLSILIISSLIKLIEESKKLKVRKDE
ncbi:hypothetical protein HRbin35_00115 [bacterium HR35]|nr:hypothetical protein HRbin35_00115 [bacterium HR35]